MKINDVIELDITAMAHGPLDVRPLQDYAA